MKSFIDSKYNKLTVKEDLGVNYKTKGRRYVKCCCECGHETITSLADVKRGHTKSCGCDRISEKVRQGHRERALKMQAQGKLNSGFDKTDEDSPFKYYMKAIQSRTRRKPTVTPLTINDLRDCWNKQGGLCIYSKIPLILSTHTEYNYPKYMQASIDRINSDIGYEVGNIQFISVTCNLAKNSMTHDEMMIFIDIIRHGIGNLL